MMNTDNCKYSEITEKIIKVRNPNRHLFKIPPLLLLLVLLLPVGSTYVCFKIRQHKIHKSIKRQIKKGVSEKELMLLKIPKELERKPNKQFTRIHSKEFRYNGEMYDIVRQESRSNTTWYWCIWDKEETALFSHLNELVHQAMRTNPEQNKEKEKLSQFLKSLFFTKNSFDFAIHPFRKFLYSELVMRPNSLNYEPLNPPPKGFLANTK